MEKKYGLPYKMALKAYEYRDSGLKSLSYPYGNLMDKGLMGFWV